MNSVSTIAGAAALAMSLAACQATTGAISAPSASLQAESPAGASPSSGPLSRMSERRPVQPAVLEWVAGLGYVRGTPEALAGLQVSLEPKPGRNRIVEACRQSVEDSAAALGAVRVEVVSAGPDRAGAGGSIEGPIETRILYTGPHALEVRHATLTCVVDRQGRVLSAQA
jgi:hypothetical protein